MEESQRRYQELVEENAWLKQQMDRNRPADTSSHCQHCSVCVREKAVGSSNGDMALWSMLERNKYLEEKIGKLRGQYEKQARTLTSIRSSEKWRNRLLCNSGSSSCYEDKYLQLLRVKSPFY